MRYGLRALLLVVTLIAAALGLREGNPALVEAMILMLLALGVAFVVVAVTLGYRAAADVVVIGAILLAFVLLLMIV